MISVQSAASAAPLNAAPELHTASQSASTPPPEPVEVDVQVSAQSRAVSSVPQAAPSSDAFAEAGAHQYDVFGSYLEAGGAGAGMSPAQIQDTQALIRDITGAMDALAPERRPSVSEQAPPRAVAELALASSAAALERVGSELPQKMQGGFQDLVKQYAAHNGRVVANYQSIRDIRDTSIATKPALPAYAEGKRRVEASETMRKLGNIAHSEVDKQEITKAYAAIFGAAYKNGTDVATMFRRVQEAFMSYASGGSRDAAVREALEARSQPVLDEMKAYWSRIMPSGRSTQTVPSPTAEQRFPEPTGKSEEIQHADKF